MDSRFLKALDILIDTIGRLHPELIDGANYVAVGTAAATREAQVPPLLPILSSALTLRMLLTAILDDPEKEEEEPCDNETTSAPAVSRPDINLN